MMNDDYQQLRILTGLEPKDLADTILQNPRAYMNLRGAVAEKHLAIYLHKLKSSGKIFDFRPGKGDFEKDFYIRTTSKAKEVALECKNIEALKISGKEDYLNFLTYLMKHQDFPSKSKTVAEEILKAPKISTIPKIKELFSSLPLTLKESGLVRYEYSVHSVKIEKFPVDQGKLSEYLARFDRHPLTVDFWRTRNSNDSDGNSAKENRFYSDGEIDILAICLFSRTLEWKFVFYESRYFPKHPKYEGRYHNRLQLDPKRCRPNFIDCL